jgi:enediyne polyketide synthase
VITWSGLRLRDVGPLPRTGPWPLALLAVYLERSTTALGLDPQLRVSVLDSRSALTTSAPASDVVAHSHLGELTLSVSATRLVACDWETVIERTPRDWRLLLGTELDALATQIRVPCGEPESTVATRVWTALECLSKIGRPPKVPLVLDGAYDGGWILLRGGDCLIASTVVSAENVAAPVAIAILTGETHAGA